MEGEEEEEEEEGQCSEGRGTSEVLWVSTAFHSRALLFLTPSILLPPTTTLIQFSTRKIKKS